MKIWKISKTGTRPYNQDYADFVTKNGMVCMAVADGLGAYDGSDIASETAVKSVLADFCRYAEKQTDMFSGTIMNVFFRDAHEAILKAKRATKRSGCTTLSILIADDHRFIVAHEGDTRIYFFRNNKLRFYSKDHSLARAAVDRGEISPSEIIGHKDQNKLTRVIGSDYYVQPDFKIYVGYEPSDSVLICTDGFWEHVRETEMSHVLKNCQNPDDVLAEMEKYLLTRYTDDCDNYTALLLRFVSEENTENQENVTEE